MSDERTAKQKHDFLLAAMKMGLQHFDVGGAVEDAGSAAFPAARAGYEAGKDAHGPQATGAQPNAANGAPNTGQNIGASLNTLPSANTFGIKDPLGNTINSGVQNVTQSTMGGVGGAMQGIAGAFTPQNTFQAGMANTANSNYGGTINQASQNSLQGAQQMQSALGQQQSFLDALRAQNGIGNQSSVFNQLQGVANGQGPNPAQAMLNQATGNNISQQAALMAGQRGAGANAGLVGRQAAMQGANIQQQAAGQGATLQANQSLNALNQLGGIAQNQIGNAQASQAGLQSGILGQQGVSNQLFSGAAGAQNAQNANDIANFNNMQSINAATAQNNTNAVGKTTGGLLGGASSLLAMLADGGYVPSNGRNVTTDPGNGTFSGVFDSAKKMMPKKPGGDDDDSGGGTAMAGGDEAAGAGALMAADGGMATGPKSSYGKACQGMTTMMMAKGGKVPALVSPGEVYLPPKKVHEVATKGKDPIKAGERIPGKPKHPGNNYANDVVKKELAPGGIVIPNSVMQSKDPKSNAAKFIQAVMAKQNMKAKK